MAERPIFVPVPDSPELVKEVLIRLVWNPGFAPIQKKKNVAALHASAAAAGYSPLLEISTKSEEKLGQRLSAFSLKVHNDRLGEIPLGQPSKGAKCSNMAVRLLISTRSGTHVMPNAICA